VKAVYFRNINGQLYRAPSKEVIPVPIILKNPLITVDGNLSDWTTAERIDTPGDFVPGYSLYGTPLTATLSPDGRSLEIAIPRSLVTPAGSTASSDVNVAGWFDTATPASAVYLPATTPLP
jgi:hypothetical protein